MKQQKILLRLSYDGAGYAGWQMQPHCQKPTLQQTLEEALLRVHQQPVRTLASGRTDAKVHALDQAVTFTSRATVPADRWPLALNPLLPDDMVVLSSKVVSNDFHVIRDVVEKTYRYRIHLGRVPDVFQRDRCLEYRYKLDLAAMREAASLLVGTHNFRAFSSANGSATSFVRTVSSIKIQQSQDNVDIYVTGQGFLYNMVRIMVGSLLEVSEKKRSSQALKQALLVQDRSLAGRTAKAAGLFLERVRYE